MQRKIAISEGKKWITGKWKVLFSKKWIKKENKNLKRNKQTRLLCSFRKSLNWLKILTLNYYFIFFFFFCNNLVSNNNANQSEDAEVLAEVEDEVEIDFMSPKSRKKKVCFEWSVWIVQM